jgi:DNA polymerase/3'-5' exonuclease PolX
MVNENIISNLEALLLLYKKDSTLKFKCKALNTSISAIKSYNQEIKCGKQAMNDIKGVGKGIAERIDEILESGTLTELGIKNEKNDIMELLKSVTGVGDTRAEKWFEMGIKSIDELRNAIKDSTIKSTHHIDLGLKYYNDLKERIPRAEMDMLKSSVETHIKAVDKDIIFEVCGSYRRGLPTSGDIDILVSHSKYMENISNEKILSKIVKYMETTGFLVDYLTKDGEKKYMGFCKLGPKNKARRIDIRVIDYISYYAGVIYFTGSQHFNIEVRNKALEKGMSLSEYGLVNQDTKEKIFLKSEAELFEILKIPYKTPQERNI